MEETGAEPERTIVFIRYVHTLLARKVLSGFSAGFDACEHEHQGMQRHDRRVPVGLHVLQLRNC